MAKETSCCVFVTTNKDTHLGIILDKDDTVSVLKEKISVDHKQCFPSFGQISVSALMVNFVGKFYHLSDSIVLSKAIQGIRNHDWYLFVDVEMLTITAEEKTKKRKMKTPAGAKKKPALGVDANETPKDFGKEVTNVIAPTLKVMDDMNESRKGNLLSEACPASNLEASSSAGDKKSSKDHIDQSLVAEDEGLKDGIVAASECIPNSSGEKITNILVLLAPEGNEIGKKDVDEATKSVKVSKKTMTKKAKAPTKEVTFSATNVEPGVVVSDPHENVDKDVKNSSKKSKKKPSSNVVEEA